ncbi:hypothetical protein L901_16340 [Agrobacterium sp. D14]|nr:hypothetical protein L901_16340 [Agrobacterium sp. D14]
MRKKETRRFRDSKKSESAVAREYKAVAAA